ncbi:MAG: peptide chain release factor 2 [Proteobacteria bacterium]|nr:peptide chain release factor 2 [Pseudomonadota bacterium]
MSYGETIEVLRGLRRRLDDLRGHLDLETQGRRVAQIDAQAADPEFWNDAPRAQDLLREQARARGTIEEVQRLDRLVEDAATLLELAREVGDANSEDEAARLAEQALSALDALELTQMLSGPHDRMAALVSINSGAGGTDSQDWAEMLLRMYLRWCERRGYKVELLDTQQGEEAGIKSATFSVEGEYAFGFLHAESGVHRLVRISPFDANARRHTAFASVAVFLDVSDDLEIDLRDEDMRFDFFRAGGAGGQHVNKTESAVRITHLPTGIVVQCQNERSQHKNRTQALRVLRARIYEHERRKRDQELAGISGEKKAIEWGNQIRSYVLAPYRLVTDHRTELKVGNVDAVLSGDLDPFIHAYLLGESRSRPPAH